MQDKIATLQPIGWIFLILSVGSVTGLVIWCYSRVLSLPREPSDQGN